MSKYIFSGVLYICSCLSVFAQSDQVTIPIEDNTAGIILKINLFQGKISVKGSDRADVFVKYAAITSDEDADHNEIEEKNGLKKISGGNLDLEMTGDGNTVTIESSNWNKNIDFIIEVPRKMDLNIQKNIGGNVDIENIEGTVNVENNIGDVSISNVTGTVNASTNAGSVKVAFTEIPDPKNMMFTSTTGDIDVAIPSGFGVNLALKTDMGDIYSDLDLTIENKVQEPSREQDEGFFKYSQSNHTYAKVGAGGPELTLVTKLGNIYLRQQK